MKGKMIVSVILIILGVGLFLFGNYVAGEVSEGHQKIARAQKGLDVGRELSEKLSPQSKELGKIAGGVVQQRIEEGKEEAAHYQMVANWLHGSGIVIFVAGLGLLVFSFVGKKKK